MNIQRCNLFQVHKIVKLHESFHYYLHKTIKTLRKGQKTHQKKVMDRLLQHSNIDLS